MPKLPPLYLASRSPRRGQLLEQIGLAYRSVDVEVDETPRTGEAPADYVARLAREKAAAGAAALGLSGDGGVVLGADTAIELDGKILGKPAGNGEARAFLGALSGREHAVLSAVAATAGGPPLVRTSRTAVVMRPIGAEEIEAYLATGEPADKAGAYAIQGRGAVFVAGIRGSYSAVMGLPLYETDQLLRELGVKVL